MAEEFSSQEIAGDHPIAFLLMQVMCDHASEAGANDIREVFSIVKGEPIKVSLSINGVEVKLKPSIDHWTQHMGERVRAKARELVGDRLRRLEDRLHVFTNKVFEYAKIEFPEIYNRED